MPAPLGSQNHLKHGGESAIESIRVGAELHGPAHEAELAVYAEIEQAGRYPLVLRNAARLQAACDLYWDAIQGAAERGDLEKLDHYISRFGWLAGASLRAWTVVKEEAKAGGPDALDYEKILERERGETDDNQT